MPLGGHAGPPPVHRDMQQFNLKTYNQWEYDLSKVFDNSGTVQMRHWAISLADTVLEVWDILGPDAAEELDLIPYDWEFVPAVLRHIEWHDSGYFQPDPKEIVSSRN